MIADGRSSEESPVLFTLLTSPFYFYSVTKITDDAGDFNPPGGIHRINEMIRRKMEGGRMRHGEEKADLVNPAMRTPFKIERKVSTMQRGPHGALRRVQLKVNEWGD